MAATDLEAQLREQQERWMDAVRRNDLATLDDILADEFVLISARLGFVDRQGWLAMVPDYNIHEFDYVHSQVHISGETAVVNSRYRQQADIAGEDLSVPFYLTDVWVRRGGRWQVVTRHSSISIEGSWPAPESRPGDPPRPHGDREVYRAMRAEDVVHRYVEQVLRGRDLEAAGELFQANVVGHEPAGEICGIEQLRQNLTDWFTTFPDFELATDDLFGQGDRVAWRWTLRGIHKPTSRPVSVSGIILFRVESSRIAEYWGHYDRLGLMRQESLISKS